MDISVGQPMSDIHTWIYPWIYGYPYPLQPCKYHSLNLKPCRTSQKLLFAITAWRNYHFLPLNVHEFIELLNWSSNSGDVNRCIVQFVHCSSAASVYLRWIAHSEMKQKTNAAELLICSLNGYCNPFFLRAVRLSVIYVNSVTYSLTHWTAWPATGRSAFQTSRSLAMLQAVSAESPTSTSSWRTQVCLGRPWIAKQATLTVMFYVLVKFELNTVIYMNLYSH